MDSDASRGSRGHFHKIRAPLAFALALGITALAQADPVAGGGFSFELIGWGVLAGACLRVGWLFALLGALALTVFRVFALAEQVCRFYLQRPLELGNDLRLLPDLQTVLTDTGGHGALAFLVLALVLFAGLATCVLRFLATERRAVMGAAFVAMAVGVVLPAENLSRRMLVELAALVNPKELERRISAEHEAVAADWSDLRDHEFRMRDVHLFLIESYGHVVFEHPRLNTVRRETLPAFGDALRDSGLSVVSGSYRSPTFGGRSWLAHASIDSGVTISGALRYERILRSELVPLAGHFGRAGYYTATVAPGIVRPYPEGDWFAYQAKFYFDQLGYTGPRYGWATVPDQWLLRHMGAILDRVDGPHFIEWHLVSTHAPFATHAPWLAPSTVTSSNPYGERKGKKFDIQWPYLENAHAGYAWALDYEFRALAEALPKLLGDHGIAILVGDHQPNGAMMNPGASWLVPCHVVFQAFDTTHWPGFVPGLVPQFSEDAPSLSQLYEDLLRSETFKQGESRKDLGAPPASEALPRGQGSFGNRARSEPGPGRR